MLSPAAKQPATEPLPALPDELYLHVSAALPAGWAARRAFFGSCAAAWQTRKGDDGWRAWTLAKALCHISRMPPGAPMPMAELAAPPVHDALAIAFGSEAERDAALAPPGGRPRDVALELLRRLEPLSRGPTGVICTACEHNAVDMLHVLREWGLLHTVHAIEDGAFYAALHPGRLRLLRELRVNWQLHLYPVFSWERDDAVNAHDWTADMLAELAVHWRIPNLLNNAVYRDDAAVLFERLNVSGALALFPDSQLRVALDIALGLSHHDHQVTLCIVNTRHLGLSSDGCTAQRLLCLAMQKASVELLLVLQARQGLRLRDAEPMRTEWRRAVLAAAAAHNRDMLTELIRLGLRLDPVDSHRREVRQVAGALAHDAEGAPTLALLRRCGLTLDAFDQHGASAVTRLVATLRELRQWDGGEQFVGSHVARSHHLTADVLRELRVALGFSRAFAQRDKNRTLRRAVDMGNVDVLRELRLWGLGPADARAVGPERLLESLLRAEQGVRECAEELREHWGVAASPLLVLKMVVAKKPEALRALREVHRLGADAVRGKPLVHAAAAGHCGVLRELRAFGLAPQDARTALVVAAGKARVSAVAEILSWELIAPSDPFELPAGTPPSAVAALRKWRAAAAP